MELKISEKIKEYRRVFGITQEKFAQDVGISSQAVSKWERGDGYPDNSFADYRKLFRHHDR